MRASLPQRKQTVDDEREPMKHDDHEMMWESAARKAVDQAVAGATLDEAEGAITLPLGYGHNGERMRMAIRSLEELDRELTNLAESEWINYAPFDGGEPVFEPNVDGYVQNAIEELKAEDFFARFPAPPNTEQLFGSGELLSPGAMQRVSVDLSEVNDELIKYLARHPEKMRGLHPRKFEELVAELFRAKGYDVELTRFSKDGGFDIRAVRRTDVGLGLTLIECKRFAADRSVGVTLIRGLHGVVEKERATGGLFVTTSYFTRSANAFKDELKHRLDLADFDRLSRMLQDYRKS